MLPPLSLVPFLPLTLLLLLLPLTHAQDQCNLLPITRPTFPLYSLQPHSLTPTNTTLCEKYTPSNSTQLQWITTLVNTAFTGDFTPLPNLWPQHPNGTYQATGILDDRAVYRDPCYSVMGVNLVKYFNGTWKSNNRGGVSPPFFSRTWACFRWWNPQPADPMQKAVAINFLDSGSVLALRDGHPAWSADSNQYKWLPPPPSPTPSFLAHPNQPPQPSKQTIHIPLPLLRTPPRLPLPLLPALQKHHQPITNPPLHGPPRAGNALLHPQHLRLRPLPRRRGARLSHPCRRCDFHWRGAR